MEIKNSQLLASFCFVSNFLFLVFGNQMENCPEVNFIELVNGEQTHLGFCPNRNEAFQVKIPPKLAKSLREWHLNDFQILLNTFPIDKEQRNFVREVRNVLFSSMKPTPLKSDIKLAAFSSEVLEEILDMSGQMKRDNEFLKVR